MYSLQLGHWRTPMKDKYNLILTLIPHLIDSDAEQIEGMLSEDVDIDEIFDYIKICLTESDRKDIVDRLNDPVEDKQENFIMGHLKARANPSEVTDFMDYYDTLSEDDRQYVTQFYYEYYSTGFYNIPEEERILKGDELLKEARRNNNSINRDAFARSQKHEYTSPIIDESELEWEKLFNIFGYEKALEKILDSAMDDLYNSDIDRKIILCENGKIT